VSCIALSKDLQQTAILKRLFSSTEEYQQAALLLKVLLSIQFSSRASTVLTDSLSDWQNRQPTEAYQQKLERHTLESSPLKKFIIKHIFIRSVYQRYCSHSLGQRFTFNIMRELSTATFLHQSKLPLGYFATDTPLS
jgi:hypothetical protein